MVDDGILDEIEGGRSCRRNKNEKTLRVRRDEAMVVEGSWRNKAMLVSSQHKC